MTELTPTIFEDIFFHHIRGMTIGNGDEVLSKRISSFDYQFSDHFLLAHACGRPRRKKGMEQKKNNN